VTEIKAWRPKKPSSESRQDEWARHSREEEHAIRQQQISAGTSHEPVPDAGAATHGRQHCAAVVRGWLDPARFMALTGPVSDDTVRAIRGVLRALADELDAQSGPASVESASSQG
jgi:hypothetical protein